MDEGGAPVVQNLRRALDAVLVPLGFLAAQGGLAEAQGEFVWCCSYDEFIAHWPHLPPSGEQNPGGTACVDVSVRVDQDRGRNWVLGRVALEGHELSEVFTAVGDGPAAAAAEALIDRRLEQVGEQLEQLVTACLAQPDTTVSAGSDL